MTKETGKIIIAGKTAKLRIGKRYRRAGKQSYGTGHSFSIVRVLAELGNLTAGEGNDVEMSWRELLSASVRDVDRLREHLPLEEEEIQQLRQIAARYPLYRETAELSFYNAFPQRTAASILKKLRGAPAGVRGKY